MREPYIGFCSITICCAHQRTGRAFSLTHQMLHNRKRSLARTPFTHIYIDNTRALSMTRTQRDFFFPSAIRFCFVISVERRMMGAMARVQLYGATRTYTLLQSSSFSFAGPSSASVPIHHYHHHHHLRDWPSPICFGCVCVCIAEATLPFVLYYISLICRSHHTQHKSIYSDVCVYTGHIYLYRHLVPFSFLLLYYYALISACADTAARPASPSRSPSAESRAAAASA